MNQKIVWDEKKNIYIYILYIYTVYIDTATIHLHEVIECKTSQRPLPSLINQRTSYPVQLLTYIMYTYLRIKHAQTHIDQKSWISETLSSSSSGRRSHKAAWCPSWNAEKHKSAFASYNAHVLSLQFRLLMAQ